MLLLLALLSACGQDASDAQDEAADVPLHQVRVRAAVEPFQTDASMKSGVTALGADAGRSDPGAQSASPSASGNGLLTPENFLAIADAEQRSVALFREVGRVMQSSRCTNCHSGSDSPLQRDGIEHVPAVTRGVDGFGDGLRCNFCHQTSNAEGTGIPGAPNWHLAPLEMAWRGKSLAQICAQVRDPLRNGNRTFEVLREHALNDSLVRWAWQPGRTRSPAPGSHAAFVALFNAWLDSGAACPRE